MTVGALDQLVVARLLEKGFQLRDGGTCLDGVRRPRESPNVVDDVLVVVEESNTGHWGLEGGVDFGAGLSVRRRRYMNGERSNEGRGAEEQ